MKYSTPLQCDKYYHIYNHAVGNENIFREGGNYLYFLKKYAELIYPFCNTYAYCLMPNHFHFLIRIRGEDEIVKSYQESKKIKSEIKDDLDFAKIVIQQFSNFFNGYAKAFNRKYDRMGALFVDYLKRIEVEDELYFTRLINYIHSNPVHHGFVKKLKDWQYSSYHSIISPKPSKL